MTTPARTVMDWYLPIQVDHDPTGDGFTVSMDNGGTFPYTATWFTTATAPPGVVAQTPQAKSGLTWYFGRVTIGPGSGNIPLNQGRNTIIGRINDGRQYPWFGWDIYVQHTQ